MAQVRIPPVLRQEAGGNRLVDVSGGTVRSALTSLATTYPALQSRIFDGEGLPSFLNVFVDGEDVRLLAGLETEVGDASTILLLPAVAGGCVEVGHGSR